jgi:polyhydroxybutyrate depolymerase
MLVFHGGGGQAKFMIKMTGMNKLSEKNDFIVVYPDGTGSKLLPALKTWNTGNCCGRAKKLNTDDTGFVRAIIKDIKRTININTEKIFATGISNGAMMSYKLACEAPDLVSGIAPVAGTLNIASCKPDQPVPVIHFHGTADNFCRYEGGVGSKSVSRRNFKSVEYSINTWKTINGCSNETSEFYKKGKAQCIQYEKCKNNSSVVLCTIIDGGHTWPDGHSQYPALMGEVNQDVNATQLMWEFFNIERSK